MKNIDSLMLVGHAGKLVKLAGGIMNTHSSIADCRMEIIAAHSAAAGAEPSAINQIMECATTEAAIEILTSLGINETVWKSIGQKIKYHINARTKNSITIECIVFTQEHGILVRGI